MPTVEEFNKLPATEQAKLLFRAYVKEVAGRADYFKTMISVVDDTGKLAAVGIVFAGPALPQRILRQLMKAGARANRESEKFKP